MHLPRLKNVSQYFLHLLLLLSIALILFYSSLTCQTDKWGGGSFADQKIRLLIFFYIEATQTSTFRKKSTNKTFLKNQFVLVSRAFPKHVLIMVAAAFGHNSSKK